MAANLLFFESYLLIDALCIIVTIIAAAQISRNSGSEAQVRTFFLFLTSYLAYVVTDGIWAYFMFSGILEPSFLAVGLVTLVNRVAIAATGYFWFSYSLNRFESELFFNKALRVATALPVVIVFAMYTMGIAFGWSFIITDPNNQQSGIDYLVVSAVALFYLIAATIAAIRGYQRATTQAQKHICTVFTAFMIAPFCAAIINLFEPYLPVVAPGILISILLILLSLQESRIFSDELTGLNNRRRANAYLEESISHASIEQPVYLFIVDMNRFKSINDTYGHLEGDHALKLMAEALRASCKTLNAFAARWGGDEFMVICAHGAQLDPSYVVRTIDANLSETVAETGLTYDLSCSVGFAECHSPDMMTNDLISEADKMLYNKKGADSSNHPNRI